jgi:cytoskeletal protein RodZ
MSTKLSLLSRAAAVAGILALALPAVAQTSQPNATAPTETKSVPSDAKADTSKVKATNKKPVKHAARKPAAKTPVVKTAAPAANTKTDTKTPPSK